MQKEKNFELYEAGEEYALDKLNKFIDQKILMYKEKRDFPAIDGTSSLSPLSFFRNFIFKAMSFLRFLRNFQKRMRGSRLG